jgi:hypothetical protein
VCRNPLFGFCVDAARRLRVQGSGHERLVHWRSPSPCACAGRRLAEVQAEVCTTVGLAAMAAVEVDDRGSQEPSACNMLPTLRLDVTSEMLLGTGWRKPPMGDWLLVVYAMFASRPYPRGTTYVGVGAMMRQGQWATMVANGLRRPWGTQPNGVSVF